MDNKHKESQAIIDNQILKVKMARNDTQQMISIFVIIIILVVALGIYIRYKEKIKINKELEQKNNQINLINQKLEEANNTKDKFFSIIAHDLKGPLGSFNNLLDYMVNSYNDFTDDDRKEFLSSINESSNSIFLLLVNLLDWSRSQRDMIVFKPEPADINGLSKIVVQSLVVISNEKNISIQNNIPENLIIILDPKLIQTVLRNLISNSIKFTPINGQITLDLNEDAEKFVISVKDNGVGMGKSKLNELFNFNYSNSTYGTNYEKGTGLGLIICKEFVDRHKGNIWVESEVGVGSTFFFSIPKSV